MAKVDRTSSRKTIQPSKHYDVGLSDEEVLETYNKLALIRGIEERIWALNRQGKVPIAASSQGHEAAQLGILTACTKDGNCFLFPYYRDVALKIAAGLTSEQVMLSFMGKVGDPYSGGRQFPFQGADLEHKIIQISNVVSAGVTQATGYALGCRMKGEDTVVMSHFGEGGSSQGEVHEAMNFAGVHNLPIVFVCENNRYAISVPQNRQMAVVDVADRAASYGFPGIVVDGMDLFASLEATAEAISHARSQGPVLLEMKVERFMPHTTDDDDRRYRPDGEVEEARRRDLVRTLSDYLKGAGILSDDQEAQIKEQVRMQVDRATDTAELAPFPDVSTINDNLYAP